MKKKGLSIKLKLTLWFTGFMALLAALCLGLILIVSSHVTQNEAFNILSLTVRNNIPKISSNNGYLSLDPDFEFYSNEVYMLIYNQNQALISGQAPPQFPVNTALENGVTRLHTQPYDYRHQTLRANAHPSEHSNFLKNAVSQEIKIPRLRCLSGSQTRYKKGRISS